MASPEYPRINGILFPYPTPFAPAAPDIPAPPNRIVPDHQQPDARETYLAATGKYIPTTNYFFRPSHRNNAAIANRIGAEILAEKPEGEHLQIWEVGCSSGRDTWSMAAACTIRGLRCAIHATDINCRSLAAAQQPYPDWKSFHTHHDLPLWDLPPETLTLFDETAAGWLPSAPLREAVSFEEFDIRYEAPPVNSQDIIIANNVFMHYGNKAFTRTVGNMIGNIATGLRPGGIFTFSDVSTRDDILTEGILAEHELKPLPNTYGYTDNEWMWMAFYQKQGTS